MQYISVYSETYTKTMSIRFYLMLRNGVIDAPLHRASVSGPSVRDRTDGVTGWIRGRGGLFDPSASGRYRSR